MVLGMANSKVDHQVSSSGEFTFINYVHLLEGIVPQIPLHKMTNIKTGTRVNL